MFYKKQLVTGMSLQSPQFKHRSRSEVEWQEQNPNQLAAGHHTTGPRRVKFADLVLVVERDGSALR